MVDMKDASVCVEDVKDQKNGGLGQEWPNINI